MRSASRERPIARGYVRDAGAYTELIQALSRSTTLYQTHAPTIVSRSFVRALPSCHSPNQVIFAVY